MKTQLAQNVRERLAIISDDITKIDGFFKSPDDITKIVGQSCVPCKPLCCPPTLLTIPLKIRVPQANATLIILQLLNISYGKYQILLNPHNTAPFNHARPATAQFNHARPATAQFNHACPATAQFKLCMPCYSTVQLTYITFFFMSATLISFRRNSLMASRSLTFDLSSEAPALVPQPTCTAVHHTQTPTTSLHKQTKYNSVDEHR